MKPYFFAHDAEKVHDRMTQVGIKLGHSAFWRWIVRFALRYDHPMLEQVVCGIRFSNPVGLAAGFDKEGLLVDILPAVGFGHAEIGSITGLPSLGNAKPRLWRLRASKALVVNYGLNSTGSAAVAKRLKNKSFTLPVGTSVAKANIQATAQDKAGVEDYLKSFKAFSDIGDYTTVNISCPNAFGGQPFNDVARLETLLDELRTVPTKKPVFVKLPPDLACEQVDRILEICTKYQVSGLVCANLTKDRDNKKIRAKIVEKVIPGPGGISGKVVEELSNDLLSYIYEKSGDRFALIGVGGIFSAEDAYEKIRRGATLVQLITGMVYNGPQLIGEINRGLVRLLKRDGYSTLSQAVGSAHRSAK